MSETQIEAQPSKRTLSSLMMPWLEAGWLRLASGFVLLFYVTTHLMNHALGLISLEAMESTMDVGRAFWRFLPISILLYGALAVHVAMALKRALQKRTLAMPMREWVQLLAGLTIPFLLIVHVMGTRYASARYGINDSYAYVLLSIFVFSPASLYFNTAGLIIAWLHGCFGFHMWARLKPWYRGTVRDYAFAFAGLLPALAIGGYMTAGRELAPFAQDGDFMGTYYEQLGVSDNAVFGLIATDIDTAQTLLLTGLALFVLAKIIGLLRGRRGDVVQVRYKEGPSVSFPVGSTLLDISRARKVPHASVCGGRGRCSTCRVRVLEGLSDQPTAKEDELRVLKRVRATSDVRLACQLRPVASLEVIRILPPETGVGRITSGDPWATGREKRVTIMFCDLRNFTQTAEQKLAYDVVYLINQFSREMGQAVEQNGGQIDKFLGDGFMAIFGLEGKDHQFDDSAGDGATQALAASAQMIANLEALNVRLEGDLDSPLRMGIGLDTGTVVLGHMGYGRARGLTAIGDTVNTSSRLESATKTEGCNMCVSAQTLKSAGLAPLPEHAKHITLRGKRKRLEIAAIDHPDQLIANNPSIGERHAPA